MYEKYFEKITSYIFCIALIACSGATAFANDTITKLTELSDYHKQLQKDYEIAMAGGNIDVRNQLIQEADKILNEMTEISEGMSFTRSNPFGTTYHNYFSKSVWITRSGVVCAAVDT